MGPIMITHGPILGQEEHSADFNEMVTPTLSSYAN